jgi:hypothetical protein
MFRLQMFQYMDMTRHAHVLKCLPDDGYLYPRNVANFTFWLHDILISSATQRNGSNFLKKGNYQISPQKFNDASSVYTIEACTECPTRFRTRQWR